jgi:Bacterial low temperature requirement A protein (LtrA)
VSDAERRLEHGDEHQVTPLELFFDLVLAFAFTQVTRLLVDDGTWGGLRSVETRYEQGSGVWAWDVKRTSPASSQGSSRGFLNQCLAGLEIVLGRSPT